MTPRCLQFELQMRILDATRDEDALEGGDADHLAECVACQIAATRHRRMISVWRASQIDEAVVRGARERFEAARSEPLASPRWREPMMFAMMGAAFGLALLVVARKIAPRHEASPRSGAVALTAPSLGAANDSPGTPGTANGGPARALTKPALGAPHVDGPRGVTALTDGLRIELKQGESAHVALNDGRTSELVGPCVVEFWSSSAEVGGWRMAHQPPASATAMLANPDDEKPKAEAADR
ncbi:MAG TPA: hypothetical protein VJT73_14540, partial [Polyangiaceae bacterium]|nr:hypothetical protein [Polyangiaceae bacterium]